MTTGTGGTIVYGPEAGAGFGLRVAALGDVNGDGRADVAVSAPNAGNGYGDGALAQSGLTYVFYGGTGDLDAQMDLVFATGAQPDGTVLSVFQGGTAGGQLGTVLAPAGDIDGDGIDDIIVGGLIPGPDSSTPEAVIVYGVSGGFAPVVEMAALTNATRLTVHATTDGGRSVTEGAGDLNGDGFADLLVTNPADAQAFILFGDGSAHPAHLNLTADFGTQKDIWTNVLSAASAGDLNDDGLDDLVLVTTAGAALVFGTSTMGGLIRDAAAIDLTGTNGVFLPLAQIIRAEPLADVNGDGVDDLLIEGKADTLSGLSTSYVLFGKSGGYDTNIDLSALTGADGFVLARTNVTAGMGGTGDVNGDGFRDFILADATGTGTVYLIFGRGEDGPSAIDLATLNGTNGYRIAGFGAAGGGQIADVNGDGFADVVFGMPGAAAGAMAILYGGAARLRALDAADGLQDGRLTVVQFGTPLTFVEAPVVPIGGGGGTGAGQPTQLRDDLVGTLGRDVIDLLGGDDNYAALSGDDDVQGGQGHDQIFGDTGNDVLKGDAGRDTLQGGAGDDTLDGGTDEDSLSGGAGDDLYIVDNLQDIVAEITNGGVDTIGASVSFTLGVALENLTLSGTLDCDAAGNGLANRLKGNAGSNLLRGFDGFDSLAGGAGADTLLGGRGADLLGAGQDSARDVFIFERVQDSRVTARDVVTGFDRGMDIIDLRVIDANRDVAGNQAFGFSSSGARAYSVWCVDAGTTVRLRADNNGDSIADFEIRVTDVAKLGLTDLWL